jgi:hypothetical protein
MPTEHIANSTSCNGKKSGPRKTVKEACHKHRLDITSHSARDYPNDEREIGPDVYWATSVELRVDEA